MGECIYKPLCRMDHRFSGEKCAGCNHRETRWQYIWAKKGAEKMENRCICCGAVIPEGRQVCRSCEIETKKLERLERKDRILWDWVFPLMFAGVMVYVLFIARWWQ